MQKKHTITLKVEKDKTIHLSNLPFSVGEEVEIIVYSVEKTENKEKVKKKDLLENVEKKENLKILPKEDESHDTFMSEAKVFSESLVVVPELDDDDFATFMGEVKSPEVDKPLKSIINKMTGRFSKNLLTKKEKKQKKPKLKLKKPEYKIPKHKIINKKDKITNRMLSKNVFSYYNAALHVLLDYEKVMSSQESVSHKFPNRFLAPDNDCKMVFCEKEEAKRKNGITCSVQINKQVLKAKGRAIIVDFIDRYEDRPYFFLGEIDPELFKQVAFIMETRQSQWKGLFRFPYRASEDKKKDILELLQQRKSRIKKEDLRQTVESILIRHKADKNAKLHFREVAKIVRFFTLRERNSVFLDTRKNLKVETILPILQKILNKMQTPYYNLLVIGELLSTNSVSFNHRPTSFGIIRIPITKVNYFQNEKLHSCLLDEKYSEKFKKVITGKIMYEEARYAIHTSGQRKEIEDLLVPFDKLKKKKRYPSYDQKIKQARVFHIGYSLFALILAFLPYSGNFWANKIPNLTYATSQISSVLIIIAAWSGWTAFLLKHRKGRKISLLGNALLAVGLGSLFYEARNEPYMYLLYTPWLALSGFLMLRFMNPKIYDYFHREFGSIHTKLNKKSTLFILFVVAIIIVSNYLFFHPEWIIR